MVIPKASNEAHVRENRAALDIALTKADLAELDRAFPPTQRRPPARDLVSTVITASCNFAVGCGACRFP